MHAHYLCVIYHTKERCAKVRNPLLFGNKRTNLRKTRVHNENDMIETCRVCTTTLHAHCLCVAKRKMRQSAKSPSFWQHTNVCCQKKGDCGCVPPKER